MISNKDIIEEARGNDNNFHPATLTNLYRHSKLKFESMDICKVRQRRKRRLEREEKFQRLVYDECMSRKQKISDDISSLQNMTLNTERPSFRKLFDRYRGHN